jgi:hypothetical protein
MIKPNILRSIAILSESLSSSQLLIPLSARQPFHKNKYSQVWLIGLFVPKIIKKITINKMKFGLFVVNLINIVTYQVFGYSCILRI